MSSDDPRPRIEKIDSSKLRPGPIRRERLSDEQLQLARSVHEIVKPFVGPFEKFELGFLRDSNPDSELQVWTAIAIAFEAFDEQNADVTDEDRQAAFTSFLVMSMGAERPAKVPESIWLKCEDIVKEIWSSSGDEADQDAAS
jgi:hypothetical protein